MQPTGHFPLAKGNFIVGVVLPDKREDDPVISLGSLPKLRLWLGQFRGGGHDPL